METMIGNASLGILFKGDLTGLQQTLAQAEGGIDRFGSKTTGTLREVNKEAKETGLTMERLANGIKGAFVGGSVAVGLIALKNQIASATGAIVEAQVQVDRLRNGFKFGAGSAEGGAKELQFVREEAKRLGLELNGTASQYMKMVAASRGGAMAGQQTRDIFQAIAEASVVMGMGVDQSERSFMAVTQMMSKGKIMAEELRGQLGEHLPGAFSIAARAMGVTEVELNKLLETGQVFSADFLPKFSAQLRKELAGSVDESTLSMQASLNRMSTAWQRFKQEVAEGGVGGALNSGVRAVTSDVTVLAETLEMSRKRGDGFWASISNTAGAAVGRATFGAIEQSAEFLNGSINFLSGGFINLSTQIDLMPTNLKPASAALVENAAKVQQAKAEYDALSARLAVAPDNIYIKSELGNLARYIARLQEAQSEQRRLMGMGSAAGPVGSVGSGDTALARAQRADYDKRLSARNAVLKQYATPGERLSEELDKQRKVLGDLFTPDLEKRITEHFVKPTKGGGRAARETVDEFAKLYDKLTMKDVGLDPSFHADLSTLHKGYSAGKITLDEYRNSVELLIASQKFAKDAADQALKATIAAAESNNAAFDELFNTREKERLSIEARIKVGREMLEDLQFETSLIGLNTKEREIATAMRELERQGVVKGTEAYKAYAEQIQKAIADKQARQEMLAFWEQVESTAESVFLDIALNGEDAFKRIGESIKREVLKLLYEMTIKKWIIQLSGGTLSGSSGGSLIDLATSAYSAYSTAAGGGAAATGAAGSAAAAGAWMGGSMSGANALGSIAANSTGTGIGGLLATNGAYGTAAGGTAAVGGTAAAAGGTAAAGAGGAAAGAGGAGGMGGLTATGWGALIVAAVVSANNLYRAGYNRDALSSAGQARPIGNYSATTGMGGGGSSSIYNNSTERLNRSILDSVGISEKWSDILSGTTRMAALFGRKLAAYGFAVDVAGANVGVKGFENYRGGLFRSDKNRTFEVDTRDQSMVQKMVEQTRAAAIEQARALGLSTTSIERWNGQLRINLKNVKDAEDAQSRYNKSLGKMYEDMLRQAQRTTFDENVARQVESVRDSARNMAAALGLSTAEIDRFSGSLDVSMKQMDGSKRASETLAKATEQLYFQMLQSAGGFNMSRKEFDKFIEGIIASAEEAGISAKGIADILVQGMTGRLSGADVGDQLASMIVGGIYTAIAQNYANTIAQAFTSQIITPIFTAIASGVPISQAISQQAINNVVATAQNAALALNAVFSDPSFRAAISGIQQAISSVAVASVRPAASVKKFGNSVTSAGKAASSAADEIKRAWTSIMDSMIDEVRRLRGEIVGSGDQALSYTVAQFASATAAARAGDRLAAERLPTISRSVEEAASRDAASRADLNAVRGWLIESQSQTAAILNARYRLGVPAFADGGMHGGGLRLVGEEGPELEVTGPARYWDAAATQQMLSGQSNAAMVAEIRAMRAELAGLRGEAKRGADNAASTASTLDDIAKKKRSIATVAA